MRLHALNGTLAMRGDNRAGRNFGIVHKPIGRLGIRPILAGLIEWDGRLLFECARQDLAATIQTDILQGHGGEFFLRPGRIVAIGLRRQWVSPPASI